MAVKTAGSPTTRQQDIITDFVISKDGTRIGYYQLGHGPGVVLVQGTMGTAKHFMDLARALSDSFTVYVPDRRGRGLSGDNDPDYNVQKEVEDLDALLTKTGTHYVFGLSAGGLISLQAALKLPAIHKLAVYEPAMFINGLPVGHLQRYEQEIAQGKTAAALVTAMQAAEMGPAIFNLIPRWLLEGFVNMGMAQEEKKGAGDYPTMRSLAPTLRHDFKVVNEMNGALESFKSIKAEMLLLGGNKSQKYLQTAMDALAQALPQAKRVVLDGFDHSAAWNRDKRGRPEGVAQELRKFFV
jgi:pimeloyl-ACP methyl ester carboxylesterase